MYIYGISEICILIWMIWNMFIKKWHNIWIILITFLWCIYYLLSFLFLNWERKFTCLCFHSVFCYNILFPYTQESCPRRVFLHSGVLGCCMIFVESQSSLLSHRLVNTDLSVSNSPMHSNHRFSTHLKILPSSGVSTYSFKSVCLCKTLVPIFMKTCLNDNESKLFHRLVHIWLWNKDR